MNGKVSWYFERKNSILGDNTLAICYKADEQEIKENNLTSDTIVILVKNGNLQKYINKEQVDLGECLRDVFRDTKIFMRIQCECLLGIYGDLHCDCEQQKNEALKLLSEKEGIYIHLPQEAQGHGLHYKLKELELQVNGRDPSGKYIGCKDRNEAQKIILQQEKFDDKRSYGIVKNVLMSIGLMDKDFVLITDSKKKMDELTSFGIKVELYKEYVEKHVDLENASEYLVKILEGTHTYDKEILEEIMNLIKSRKYNERTINTFLKIIEKIKDESVEYSLDEESKQMFLEAYSSIICGVEKIYKFNDSNITKVQNKFSCKVNNRIFGVLKLVFDKNIFSRISSEELYFFHNTKEDYLVRIRDSKVLEVEEERSLFLKGQEYLQQTIFLNEKKKMIENEVTRSKLSVYFENKDFVYNKKIDMITFISEGELEGVNVYIKRLPNVENHVMDVYGKKEKIIDFIKRITVVSDKIMLSMISNIQLEDEEMINGNLVFADRDTAIKEEVAIYNLLKK